MQGNFAQLDDHADQPLDGVVLDLGVSSMQLDLPERGFFRFPKTDLWTCACRKAGRSARDIVNGASEEVLADILFHFGEERASRRIARGHSARARAEGEIEPHRSPCANHRGMPAAPETGAKSSGHPQLSGLAHTAVNAEFDALVDGLEAAERALKPGGKLAVVSFHSLEDRVVKAVLWRNAPGRVGGGNRFARPKSRSARPGSTLSRKRAFSADAARAKTQIPARALRACALARRTDAPAGPADRSALGLPRISGGYKPCEACYIC